MAFTILIRRKTTTPKNTTGDDVLKQRLSVMDLTAFTLCRENNTPIIVFNMNERGNFKKIVVDGEDEGTTVVWE